MRLSEFILDNVEPILADWERYARSIWPGVDATPEALRDHAEDMLRSVVGEMGTPQTPAQQRDKALGRGGLGAESLQVDSASRHHAESRSAVGFDLRQLVAEYRALRASVIRLWQQSDPEPDTLHLDDMIRFNEAIDQLLAESVLVHTEEINRSREMFLGILAHDLRNPLSAVAMLAEVLKLEDAAPEALESACEISTLTASMTRMVDDLLEFAAMRIAPTFVLSPAPTDLRVLCREALSVMSTIHPHRQFHLEEDGELPGEWDASRLKQLLSNLLGNAAQHGAEDHPIVLSLEGSASEVVLAVRNRGPVIPADEIALLFEPLKRSTSTETQRNSGGVGLGLYIAREIVVAHGGRIDARSDEEATVFTVRLPRFCKRSVPAETRCRNGAAIN
ncbi:MAG: sensor histidine kinase [Opitutales bacterium]